MRMLIAASLLALVTSTAVADTATPQTPDVVKMASDDCARARKHNKPCVLDMGKEEITGQPATAGGSAISIATYARHDSLIRIRRDFIVEILKTTEDLD